MRPPSAWISDNANLLCQKTNSSKSSDSTCNCSSGDGQSICSGSIDIEYIPPPAPAIAPPPATSSNDNPDNVDSAKTDEVKVVEEVENTKVMNKLGNIKWFLI